MYWCFCAGIGVDDMFQLLTQWRHTSVLDAIDARLGVTMRSAAVALTITSLADILAFCIGATSPFSSVKFFCALSGQRRTARDDVITQCQRFHMLLLLVRAHLCM